MRTGEIVKIKDAAGSKVKARVVKVERQTEAVDMSSGGIFGNPADVVRHVVPGRTTTTLTLELISEIKPPKTRKLKLGDKGPCQSETVDGICGEPATAQHDPYVLELYDEKVIVLLCENHVQERWSEV